jgi:outer membrane protein
MNDAVGGICSYRSWRHGRNAFGGNLHGGFYRVIRAKMGGGVPSRMATTVYRRAGRACSRSGGIALRGRAQRREDRTVECNRQQIRESNSEVEMKRNMTSIRKIGVALMMFMMTGCSLVAPTDPYRPVKWSHAPLEMKDFRGDRAAGLPSVPLTLDHCVEFALRHNPDIGRAGWDIATAGADLDISRGQQWPTINAVGSFTHSVNDLRLVQPRFPNESGAYGDDLYAGDLQLTMPLFTGGRIVNEIKATQAIQKSTQHLLARTRQELVFNVTSVFYSILAQRRVIESVRFSEDTLREHSRRVKDMLEVQKAATVELLRTEVRLADLAQRRVAEENTLSILRRLLSNLLGVGDIDSEIDVVGALALTDEDIDLNGSLQVARDQRPDYLSLNAQLVAQARRVDVARAGRWPTVSLEGSYGLRHVANADTPVASSTATTGGTGATGATSISKEADTTEDVGFVGVSVVVPLFEGGRIYSRVRKERSKLGALQQALRSLELRVRLEVQTAVLNVGSSKERVLATQKAIEQGKESLRIEREKYELGRGSITDVLDAESAFLDIETTYYRALADHNSAFAEWRLAVGRE